MLQSPNGILLRPRVGVVAVRRNINVRTGCRRDRFHLKAIAGDDDGATKEDAIHACVIAISRRERKGGFAIAFWVEHKRVLIRPKIQTNKNLQTGSARKIGVRYGLIPWRRNAEQIN